MSSIIERAQLLLDEWHEVGRESFSSHNEKLYDRIRAKRLCVGLKYFELTEDGRPVWIIEVSSENVFRAKDRHRPDRTKCLGHIDTVLGQDLHDKRDWDRRRKTDFIAETAGAKTSRESV